MIAEDQKDDLIARLEKALRDMSNSHGMRTSPEWKAFVEHQADEALKAVAEARDYTKHKRK